MKIVIDSCIYDKLYENKETANKLVNLINTDKVSLYGTEIQSSQIAANTKEQDKEKVDWSLNFSKHYVQHVAAPFCWGVSGAGWEQGTWITNDQQEIYDQIEPNSKRGNNIEDRAIAVAKLDCDMFVTEDKKFRSALLQFMKDKKIFNWNEFKTYISDLN